MDEDFVDDSDNDEEEIDDADEEDIIALEQEVVSVQGPKVIDEEYRYDILTGDQVVEFMQDIIKDVNSVVQVELSHCFWHIWKSTDPCIHHSSMTYWGCLHVT